MRSLTSSRRVWKVMSFLFATLAVVSFGNAIVGRYVGILEEANSQLVLRHHVAAAGAELATDEVGRTTGFVRLATDQAGAIDGQLAIPMQSADAGAEYRGVALMQQAERQSDALLTNLADRGHTRIVPVAGVLDETQGIAVAQAFPQLAGSGNLPILRIESGIETALSAPRPPRRLWISLVFAALAIVTSVRAAMPVAAPVPRKPTQRPRNPRHIMALRRFDPVVPQERLEAHRARRRKVVR